MKLLWLFFIIITCFSCSKEDEYKYDPCIGDQLEQDILIYDTLHNPVSSYLQYQLYDTLTFQDSLGNELKLVAIYADSIYSYEEYTSPCNGYTQSSYKNLFGVHFHHTTEPWEIDLYVWRYTPYNTAIHPSCDIIQVSTRYDILGDYIKGSTGYIYPESNNTSHPEYGLINGVAVNAQSVSILRNDTLIQNIIIVTEYAYGGKVHFYLNTNYELVGFSLTDYSSPQQWIYPDINVCQWMLKSYW